MPNPFSKTQSHYFRQQASLIGANKAHLGKFIQQHPGLPGTQPKAQRHAESSEKQKVVKATRDLNRHHAYKALTHSVETRVRKAAYVVLNTPTGEITDAYAKAIRTLADYEKYRADQKKAFGWTFRAKKLTPAQQEIAIKVASEKMAVKIKNEMQSEAGIGPNVASKKGRNSLKRQLTSQISRQLTKLHIQKAPTEAKPVVDPELDKLNQEIDDFAQELNEFNLEITDSV